ncbi:hypothetical protein M407DRAFT_20499 [Tulasnella calospora MUT 4182]|uniref:Transmembrane protein n=1 Tax=Tulasnella calospora MUT 4182 TaxID=1051891 RepID=A0A0C3M9R7_9AGAM|nr:hypothetical protein M407DRAFT_20499 [Tulasnella calospora MUT 4182]
MPRRFFKGFTKDVDHTDVAYVKNEKERNVQISVNPFRSPQQNLPGGAANEDEERPPEWLELAGDLAWTATFSSLTSNTAVTEPNAVWNYAVFFGLTWHLWATQTTYDIKYYTNDWWHRFFFGSQLGVYAVLASFSGSFNVAWKVHPVDLDIFVGDSGKLTGEAMLRNQDILIARSFRGINMTLFLSRMFLLVQYVRVLWYRYKSRQFWSWRFLLTPLATLGAGGMFLSCFIMLQDLGGTRTVAIMQLCLWALAIFVQMIAAAFTPEDENLALKSTSAMAPRLSTLTVIIMGEGLNAICATLRNTISSLGLTPRMISESATMLLILYFVWLIYFDGFRVKNSPSRPLEEVWLWLHFPLHLSLILLLEGMKNLFLYINVLEALALLGAAFQEVVTHLNETGEFRKNTKLEKLLLVLNMSWEQEVNDVWTAAINSDSATRTDATASQMWRWWSTVTHNVILMYNENTDQEGEYWFDKLVGSDDTVVANDMYTGGPLVDKFTGPYYKLMGYSAHWVIVVGGALFVCMAILNVMQRRPRNRFAWGYSLSRFAIGCFLIVFGAAMSNVSANDWHTWIIPTVAICYSFAIVADWVLLYLSLKSIKQQEGPASPNAPEMYNLGDDGSTGHLYPAPLTGSTYSSGSTTPDPYASGQYQPVATMYPPIQHLPPYQANINGSRRSYY